MGLNAKKRTVWFLTAGAAAVLTAAVLSILYGSTGIPPRQVMNALINPDLTDQQHRCV